MDTYAQMHNRVKFLFGGGCRCRPYSNYWEGYSQIFGGIYFPISPGFGNPASAGSIAQTVAFVKIVCIDYPALLARTHQLLSFENRRTGYRFGTFIIWLATLVLSVKPFILRGGGLHFRPMFTKILAIRK